MMVFKGFCALHYCAYFGFKSLFELIFEKEWDITTGQDVYIEY